VYLTSESRDVACVRIPWGQGFVFLTLVLSVPLPFPRLFRFLSSRHGPGEQRRAWAGSAKEVSDGEVERKAAEFLVASSGSRTSARRGQEGRGPSMQESPSMHERRRGRELSAMENVADAAKSHGVQQGKTEKGGTGRESGVGGCDLGERGGGRVAGREGKGDGQGRRGGGEEGGERTGEGERSDDYQNNVRSVLALY
jgi:hypothetical protein